MSEAGSDEENRNPDNSRVEETREEAKEPEPAPKRRRLGKVQKAK